MMRSHDSGSPDTDFCHYSARLSDQPHADIFPGGLAGPGASDLLPVFSSTAGESSLADQLRGQ